MTSYPSKVNANKYVTASIKHQDQDGIDTSSLCQNQHLSQPKVDFVSLSNILLYILGDPGNARKKTFFLLIDVFPNQVERYMVAFKRDIRSMLFLAVQDSSIGDLVTHSVTHLLILRDS